MLGSGLVLWGSGTAWIVGLAVKGTVVLLLVLLGAATLRRASAGSRHLVWSGGILVVLLLPIVSVVSPWRLPVSFVQLPAAAPVAIGADASASTAEAHKAEQAVSVPGRNYSISEREGTLSGLQQLPWLFLIWGGGVVFFLGRLGFGAMLIRRVVHGATPLDSPDWTHPLIEGADRLAVARLPRLLTDDGVPMPVVCGVFNPAIVVPAGAGEWTERRRRAVLCHELAHIRRYDLPANLLGRLACALHWFNPLVWVAARKLRIESERACDDLVLGVGTRPSEYADHLLQIVGVARHGQAPAVAIPMAQRREFEGRMLAILDRDVRREPPSRGQSFALAVLAVLLLPPIAAVAPVPATPTTAATTYVTPTPALESGTANSQLLAALLEGLNAPQADERADAANALGTLNENAAVGPLGERLNGDAEQNVRLTAAWALGRIANPDAMGQLAVAVLDDVDSDVRGMAAWAMGQIADPAALPTLDAALRDASGAVRNRAAWAIGAIRPSHASTALIAALHDAEDDVREMAAWAIGQTGDPAAVPALIAAIRDPFPKVGIAALWSLAQIGGPAVHQPLVDARGWRYVDSKMNDAIEQALAGEPVDPQLRSWSIPTVR